MSPALSAPVRRMLRDLAGLDRRDSAPVSVIPGDSRPVMAGCCPYHTTASGTVVRHPSAYKRVAKSAQLTYNPSSRVVEVGADWLIGLLCDLATTRGSRR